MATLTSKLILELVDRATGPARAVAAAVNKLTAMQARNTAALATAQSQMVGAVAAAYGLAHAISAPIRSAVGLESVMADIAKVTSFSDDALKGFENTLRKMAVDEIPLAVEELGRLSANAAQGGVPEVDLADFTRLTAKAAVAWGMTGDQAGEALAKIRTALNLSNTDLFKYADAINHLSDRTAASAPDMVDFSRRVSAQGEFFGFAAKDTLAFGAAMISAGAQSDVAATSFRNMGKALTAGDGAKKSLRAAYKDLGLDPVKTAKRMQKDAVRTTIDVIERISKLPKWKQASVMSDFFGDEARALAPLLARVEMLKEALGLVSDETKYAGSVSKEFESRSKTTANALQLFKNRVNELGISVGSALLPPLNDALGILGPMALRLADWADKHPALTRAVVMTTAGLIGLRIAGIAAKWGLLWMWGGALAVAKGALLGVAAASKVAAFALLPFGAAFRAARTAMIGFAAASAILGTGGALRMAGAAMLGLLNPIRLVAGAFRLLTVALIGTGVGAALVAIGAAGTFIYNNWSGIKAMFGGIGEGIMTALKPVMPAVQPVVDGFGWLADKVSALLGPLNASNESWRAFGVEIGTTIGGAITTVIQKVQELIGWFAALPGRINEAAAGLYDVGANLLGQLWEGMKAKLGELLEWVSSIPGKIKGAIGGLGSAAPAAAASAAAAPAVEGARAAGGPVRAGMAYLVGERGPELFRPSYSGAISSTADTVRMIKANAMAGAARHSAGGGNSTTVHVGGIHVQAAPGQSPEAIAAAVERRLSEKLAALSRASYSDGAYE